MKLTLTIPSLGAGGAERVVSLLANAWAQQNWRVTLLTLDDGSAPPFFPLHPAVVHRSLGVLRDSGSALAAVRNNARRIRTLRRAITVSQPDVVISFLERNNVLTLLATIGVPVPVIVSERNDPYRHAPGKIWDVLRRYVYLRAAAIVLLSERSKSYFSPAIQKRCWIIPNPVLGPAQAAGPERNAFAPMAEKGARKTALAMGRLVEQKGFDLLLAAFARIAAQHPDWQLDIWGEGALRTRLEAQCVELGLAAQVRFPGRTTAPAAHMREADLFILSSRHEGFPNVLAEAMACGLPVVSFDCRTGPREIIRDGVDGVLVPDGDVAALADTIDRVMGDARLRERLAQRAPEVVQRFSLEQVMEQWSGCVRGAHQHVESGKV